MNRLADLHMHTHYSDGTFSPRDVVMRAIKAELSCISVTDHDTIDGVAPTQELAKQTDLEVISGIEMSSEISGKDIHILGYFVDIHNAEFMKAIQTIQQARIVRIERMIEKLKKEGINNIQLEEVCALSQSKSVGRPHLAAILVQKGWVGSLREAFNRYIAEDRPAYVEKYVETPHQVISLIQKAGGVAVLAHPMLNNRDELIPGFVEAGLKGIEVYYPNVSVNITSYYEGIARKHNLIKTGGSDAHGEIRENTYIGKIKVSYEVVEQLRRHSGKS